MTKKRLFSEILVRGVISSSLFSLLSKIIAFLVSLVLFRALSLHEYGTYQLIIATWGFFTVFLFQGLSSLIISEVSKLRAFGDELSANKLISGFFIFLALLCSGLFVAVNAYYIYSLRGVDPSVGLALRVLALTLIVHPFGLLMRLFFAIDHEFIAMNAVTALEDVLKMCAILLVFFIFDDRRAVAVIVCLAGATFFANIAFLPFVLRRFSVILKTVSRSSFATLVNFVKKQGIWAILQKQVRQVGQNSRIFLVEFILGREALALYSFGEKVVLHISALLPLDDVLIPLLSAEATNRDRVARVFRLGAKCTIWFFAPLSIALLFLVPPMIPFIFPQYVEASTIVRVLALSIPFSGVAMLLSSLFVSYHSQRRLFFLVVIRWLWFFPVGFTLFKIFGLLGVALEYVISLLLFNFLRYKDLTRVNPWLVLRWRDLVFITTGDRALLKGVLQGSLNRVSSKLRGR